MSSVQHRVDVGDPQIDEHLAKCSCGEKFKSEYKNERMAWAYTHMAWMAYNALPEESRERLNPPPS